MSGSLTIDQYIQQLESQGHTVLTRTNASGVRGLRAAAPAGGDDGPEPTPTEGMNRIVQFSLVEKTEEDKNASIPDISVSVPTGDLPVTMTSSSLINDKLWEITAAYGAKNGYLILPRTTPGAASDLGGTIYDVCDVIIVRRSDNYPVWQIVWEMSIIFSDGVTKDYYSIRKIGTTKCWTIRENSKVDLKDFGAPFNLDVQIFELVPVMPNK